VTSKPACPLPRAVQRLGRQSNPSAEANSLAHSSKTSRSVLPAASTIASLKGARTHALTLERSRSLAKPSYKLVKARSASMLVSDPSTLSRAGAAKMAQKGVTVPPRRCKRAALKSGGWLVSKSTPARYSVRFAEL
jgi:hypothetical protein